jgi:hypothetical protein
MRSPLRRRIALSLFAAALLGMGASSASAQSLDRDFVTGAWGQYPSQTAQLVILFDASSGPSGQDPTGTVTLELDYASGLDVTAARYNVTCLKVSGNRAAIGGVLVFQQLGPPLSPNAVFYVEDGVGGAPDGWVLGGTPSSPPTICPDPLPAGHPALVPSVGRDLIIHDAVEPLPTSKTECKNGGWRNFAGFKNEGQCIAFVNRGS